MTPLERAARAAAEQHGEDWDQLPERYDNQRGDLDRLYFYEQARAVIEAIREPSEAMTGAPEKAEINDGFFPHDVPMLDDKARACWIAMIDALLAEGK